MGDRGKVEVRMTGTDEQRSVQGQPGGRGSGPACPRPRPDRPGFRSAGPDGQRCNYGGTPEARSPRRTATQQVYLAVHLEHRGVADRVDAFGERNVRKAARAEVVHGNDPIEIAVEVQPMHEHPIIENGHESGGGVRPDLYVWLVTSMPSVAAMALG